MFKEALESYLSSQVMTLTGLALDFSWGLSGRALVIKGFGGGDKFGR